MVLKRNSLGLVGFLMIAFLNSSHLLAAVQSIFKGPVQLKVWQHWQQSWNVEDETEDSWLFKLVQEKDVMESAVTLTFKTELDGVVAQLQCSFRQRIGAWQTEYFDGSTQKTAGVRDGGVADFRFNHARECLDEEEQRNVAKISFKILSGSRVLYSYSLSPMYVRGKGLFYWNNPISSYSAHAGAGNIKVATVMSGESGWDTWQGRIVRPNLNFVDLNTVGSSAQIGLHRHQNNQEAYLLASGEVVMKMGIAAKKGQNYSVERKWNDSGEYREVEEFAAEGGWIEERRLLPGQIAVIVPGASGDDHTVYFHGLQATKDSLFWTMGSRN